MTYFEYAYYFLEVEFSFNEFEQLEIGSRLCGFRICSSGGLNYHNLIHPTNMRLSPKDFTLSGSSYHFAS